MAVSPWLALRQAAEAVANDRPDEAHRLIEPLIAEGYRKAWKLAREVVARYVARGRRFLDQDNTGAAWRELLAAEALNTGEKCVSDFRLTLTRLGLVQVKAALEAGNPVAAVTMVERLRDRGVRHPDLPRMLEAAQDWILAADLADKGEFLRSAAELEKVRPRLEGPTTGLDRYAAEVEARHERFRSAVARLYDAAEARRWRDALAAAEEVLLAAPEHREAKAIKAKAWQAAHPETAEYVSTPNGDGSSPGSADVFAATRYASAVPVSGPSHPGVTRTSPGTVESTEAGVLTRNPPSARPSQSGSFGSSPGAAPLPKRFLLWIDGVGGYLVCLGTRVTFGQATLEGPVDIPLYADVSRLHAEVTRDGEGYVIESAKGLMMNGRLSTRSVLSPGDRVTLGTTCQFLFHRPVPVSSTARLELTSGHRLNLPVDGVLLMGNELILGAGPQAHVVVPELIEPVLLYRSKEGLGVRVPAVPFRVDDRPFRDRATLPLPSVVTAETFTFAVEPVGPRL